MRLSVERGDEGHCALAYYADVQVLLDGVEVRDCITADTELGLVICYAPEAYVAGEEMTRIEKRGKVEILRNGAPLTSTDLT
jgi:hypothetical protein